MLNLPTNINKPERIARGVIGVILMLGGLVGAGPVFMFIIGILLVAEASLSFCGIIHVWNMIGEKKAGVQSSTTPPSNTTSSSSTNANPSSTTTSDTEKKQ